MRPPHHFRRTRCWTRSPGTRPRGRRPRPGARSRGKSRQTRQNAARARRTSRNGTRRRAAMTGSPVTRPAERCVRLLRRCCSRRWRVAATSTGTTPAITRRPTTPSSRRASSPSRRKFSGYITAVPVTDNQHVVAGQVIARIDDRDYRTALAQAEAQVAAAQASIAQHRCADRRPAGPGGAERSAGAAAAGQPDLRAAAVRHDTAPWPRTAGAPPRTPSNGPRSSARARRRCRPRKDAVVAAARQLGVLKAQRGTRRGEPCASGSPA